MNIKGYRFDRMEFSGSLGDLGTLVPLSVALILMNGLSATAVLLMVGVFYLLSGIYFKLPIPVQPLKLFAAIAIASPVIINESVIAAAGILFGIIMLIIAASGFVDWLSKIFTKPIIRGIQLGLGFILINKGISLIQRNDVFFHHQVELLSTLWVSLNSIMGIVAFIVVLLLLTNRKYPAALVIICVGILVGIFGGAFAELEFSLGPTRMEIMTPSGKDYLNAFIMLVLPQLPLTLGNAVIGTADTCSALFGKGKLTERVTYRRLAASIGGINILTGLIAGMPMCHGAGGLAAHYRFGARTGGSNIMIGAMFIGLALIFGKLAVSFLSGIPNAVLGVLLLFAGFEIALLIRDVKEKEDLFIVLFIAGLGVATSNMGLAFVAGICIRALIKIRNIKI